MNQRPTEGVPESCLYFGRVMHRRLRPFTHRFSYRVFSLLLDIDALPRLARRLRLFSYNRFNLFSFFDGDHGPRDGSALRPWIERHLAEAGIDAAGGPIRLLCFPRVLGYVFNPLSLWFCYQRQGELAAILYEVRNTFGEKHGYLIPVAEGASGDGPILQRCAKGFYVSPFLPMEGGYRFRLRQPDERLSVLIRQHVAAGEVLIATMTGRRAALSDSRLARAALAYPLLTLKVIAAIHWEALRLWVKGASLQRRPKPPTAEVSRPLEQFQQAAE